MNWQEVCNDPLLRDLPYKIELNEWGQIVMSPASNLHGILQAALIWAMAKAREDGTLIAGCSVNTPKGVKVADLAWASRGFMSELGEMTPYTRAPEVCVEITSPANSGREMEEKREIYFATGAQEFWLCDEQGGLSFYDCSGQIPASRIFPEIRRIESAILH